MKPPRVSRLTPLLSASLGALLLFFCASSRLSAQTTAFTYQGQLNNNGAAANGTFDFQFSLLDAATNGNLIAGPVTNAATVVSNGQFSVKLDFGPKAFTGAPRWLEIGVRTNGATNTFKILQPRQPVAALPRPLPIAEFNHRWTQIDTDEEKEKGKVCAALERDLPPLCRTSDGSPLTPRFSGVPRDERVTVNRFNGFPQFPANGSEEAEMRAGGTPPLPKLDLCVSVFICG